MDGRVWRRIVGVAVAFVAAVLAPSASASIRPTVTLDQSGGTTAAATVPLTIDVKFAPTSDSPKDMTIVMPSGLLANAAVDGGACLSTTGPDPNCRVGTGTVTGSLFGIAPVPLPVDFYLVKPPDAGDLGGLLIETGSTPLGPPAAITVRPSGDPAGMGLNIAVTGIPNFSGLITVDEIKSTFSAIRLPASCPSTPAAVTIMADSYKDTTQKQASAPLDVTGCSVLPFAPGFAVTATRDATDTGVALTTDITQPANPPGATPSTVALTVPETVVAPNIAAVLNGGLLCANPSSGTCKTIGTSSAVSPLYPGTLTGQAYLTGALLTPSITIIFPPPFPLSLSGSVSLATSTTTFRNVPDIPLTDLRVSLAGGPSAAFMATCAPTSGTATSTLTTQDGRSASVSAPFTVAGCTGGVTKPGGSDATPTPLLSRISLSGLAAGAPRLSFRLTSRQSKIAAFTVALPPGLSFAVHHRHHRLAITGLSLGGAKAKSLALSHGRLTIILRRPVSSVSVRIGRSALRETLALRRRAKHHRLGVLRLTITTREATGRRSTVTGKIHATRVSRVRPPG